VVSGAESEYPAAEDDRPGVMISAWAQYVLDRYATVAEAVANLEQRAIKVLPVVAPNGAAGTVHLAISDPSGDSAIFE
jgi:penicillin V acylase-like amidase (Ntn superfamily)